MLKKYKKELQKRVVDLIVEYDEIMAAKEVVECSIAAIVSFSAEIFRKEKCNLDVLEKSLKYMVQEFIEIEKLKTDLFYEEN